MPAEQEKVITPPQIDLEGLGLTETGREIVQLGFEQVIAMYKEYVRTHKGEFNLPPLKDLFETFPPELLALIKRHTERLISEARYQLGFINNPDADSDRFLQFPYLLVVNAVYEWLNYSGHTVASLTGSRNHCSYQQRIIRREDFLPDFVDITIRRQKEGEKASTPEVGITYSQRHTIDVGPHPLVGWTQLTGRASINDLSKSKLYCLKPGANPATLYFNESGGEDIDPLLLRGSLRELLATEGISFKRGLLIPSENRQNIFIDGSDSYYGLLIRKLKASGYNISQYQRNDGLMIPLAGLDEAIML
jgi:hypothetical protein